MKIQAKVSGTLQHKAIIEGDGDVYVDNNDKAWTIHFSEQFGGWENVWGTTREYGGVVTRKFPFDTTGVDEDWTNAEQKVTQWIDNFVVNFLVGKAADDAIDAADSKSAGPSSAEPSYSGAGRPGGSKGVAITPKATIRTAPPPSNATTPELINPAFASATTSRQKLSGNLPTVPRYVAAPVSLGLGLAAKFVFGWSAPVSILISVGSFLLQRSGNIARGETP
jgi:hypothetical protein